MKAHELRDKILDLVITHNISMERFLKGELSYCEAITFQKEIGPWEKIVDKRNPNALIKVFHFKRYNVFLGTEIWFDLHEGPIWESSWLHEYSTDQVDE